MKISFKKLLITTVLSLISLGIVPIICIFNVKFLLYILFEKCRIEDSFYFLVINSDKKYYLCYSLRENFVNDCKRDKCMKDPTFSKFMGNEINNKQNKNHIVYLNKNRLWNI